MLRMTRFLLLLCGLMAGLSARAQTTYSITKYGAVAGGKTLATAAIQMAIDACHGAGDGTVGVPPGRVASKLPISYIPH